MNKDEMLAFIEKNVTQQGNEGAIHISPLLLAMVEKLFTDPTTGVAPIVVNIEDRGEKKGTRTTYQVTTPQDIIDAYIDSANATKERTRMFVEDRGALIGFNYVEIDELTLTGKAVFIDGEFCAVISKTPGQSYFYHEEKITALPQVTRGEVEAYKMIFDADYDKQEDEYKLRVGAVIFSLSPAEMIIVNEEYNKTSTDGNYTAIWANSISRYIRCAPWFEGFQKFNLHSAFQNSKSLIFVDLHTEVLSVADLTGAFAGCDRLEQISGIMEVDSQTRLFNAFQGCGVLRVFKMHGLASNLDISDCPMLAFEVFEEILQYCAENPLTITVHATTKNNIDTNPAWQSVRDLQAQKTNVTIKV